MILPRTSFPKLTERELNSYYFTKWTGGVGRALVAADKTYKYIDIYNDDSVEHSASINSIISIYDEATFTIEKKLKNSSTITVLEKSTLAVNGEINNYNTITIKSTGTLKVIGNINNYGTIIIESGGILIISGTIYNYKSITTNTGSIIKMYGGKIIISNVSSQSFSSNYFSNDISIVDLHDFIYKSVIVYVLLEKTTDELLSYVGLTKDSNFVSENNYDKVFYKKEIIKVGTLTNYIEPSIIGYSLEESYQVTVTDTTSSIVVGKFSKKSYNVIITELIENDYSSGPNMGSIVVSSIPVKFFDKVSYDIKSYNGFSYLGIKSNLSNATYDNSLYETNVINDTNFYILYDIIEYAVNYILNGMSGASLAYYTIISGLALQVPTSETGSFDGWYLDSLFTRKKEVISVGEYGDTTLYAKYLS